MSGYHRVNRSRSVPSRISVRVCRSRWAPTFDHCIGCFLGSISGSIFRSTKVVAMTGAALLGNRREMDISHDGPGSATAGARPWLGRLGQALRVLTIVDRLVLEDLGEAAERLKEEVVGQIVVDQRHLA